MDRVNNDYNGADKTSRDLKASPCLEGKGDPQKVRKIISDGVGENIAYKNTDKAGWRQVRNCCI